jgi:hypothetical protein
VSDVPIVGGARRRRLPQRRPSVTESIEFMRGDGSAMRYEATISFDELCRPKEIFLFGAKEGTDMAAVLADTAVALSVALQHGVLAEAMAVSISRVAELGDQARGRPTSIIGAALDLLARYEREMTAVAAAPAKRGGR